MSPTISVYASQRYQAKTARPLGAGGGWIPIGGAPDGTRMVSIERLQGQFVVDEAFLDLV